MLNVTEKATKWFYILKEDNYIQLKAVTAIFRTKFRSNDRI